MTNLGHFFFSFVTSHCPVERRGYGGRKGGGVVAMGRIVKKRLNNENRCEYSSEHRRRASRGRRGGGGNVVFWSFSLSLPFFFFFSRAGRPCSFLFPPSSSYDVFLLLSLDRSSRGGFFFWLWVTKGAWLRSDAHYARANQPGKRLWEKDEK